MGLKHYRTSFQISGSRTIEGILLPTLPRSFPINLGNLEKTSKVLILFLPLWHRKVLPVRAVLRLIARQPGEEFTSSARSQQSLPRQRFLLTMIFIVIWLLSPSLWYCVFTAFEVSLFFNL